MTWRAAVDAAAATVRELAADLEALIAPAGGLDERHGGRLHSHSYFVYEPRHRNSAKDFLTDIVAVAASS
jgi:hypothetical protein